jgi:hypothetical protein
MFELFLGLVSLSMFGAHVYDLHLQRTSIPWRSGGYIMQQLILPPQVQQAEDVWGAKHSCKYLGGTRGARSGRLLPTLAYLLFVVRRRARVLINALCSRGATC